MAVFMTRELLTASGIVAICVVVHIGSIMFIAQLLLFRFSEREGFATTTRQARLLLFVFALVISLHVVEIGIWATFYYWRGLFPDFETALYFSFGTYSTIGYGDVVLPQGWRLLGGVEGLSGVLLCGLSAAFIFAVVNTLFQSRFQRAVLKRQEKESL